MHLIWAINYVDIFMTIQSIRSCLFGHNDVSFTVFSFHESFPMTLSHNIVKLVTNYESSIKAGLVEKNPSQFLSKLIIHHKNK